MGAIASHLPHNQQNAGAQDNDDNNQSTEEEVGGLHHNLTLAPPTPHGHTRRTPSRANTEGTQSSECWADVVDRFTSQLLDKSFLVLPVRGSTVEAADQYPSAYITAAGKKQFRVNGDFQECLMPGTHKHLGGAYDATDGCIYGVPANSRSVLCLYPTTKEGGKDKSSTNNIQYKMKTIPLPEEIQEVRMKWLRGIFAHGCLWALPSGAPKVLCVDVDAYWGRRETNDGDVVQLLDLPPEHPTGQIWQWHGAGINHEQTAIFCIPSNALAVLKVDLATKTTSLINIEYDKDKYQNFDLTMTNKWYGGIVATDNCVYGIPYRAGAVLRIDTKANKASLVGPDFGCHLYNWHGGIHVNGKIYAHPSHAETVLCIDTNPCSASTNPAPEPTITELPIHRAEYDKDERKQYKWLGGNVGTDGNIYCPACDTSSVLKINVTNDYCSTFGFAGTAKNKWQGGVLSKSRDGCIYCIPASGTQVLRIATHPKTIGGTTTTSSDGTSESAKPSAPQEAVQLIGNLPVHKDKWQGGYEGKDGCLYFVPENGYRVLRVIPPLHPPKLVNGKLPENDVKMELM